MSEVKFNVEVYDETDKLENTYTFADERYDVFSADAAMDIAKSAARWITPEKGRFIVERK
jgi:hypothetical protein